MEDKQRTKPWNGWRREAHQELLVHLPVKDLIPLVLEYAKYKKPNYGMSLHDMKVELALYDSVVSNSPKNRKRLYDFLESQNITFHREVVGYTEGKKRLWQARDDWDPRRIAKWIGGRRLDKKEVQAAFRAFQKRGHELMHFEDIQDAWNPGLSDSERHGIMDAWWKAGAEHSRVHPFQDCFLYTTIVRVSLGKKAVY
jgi:hypothetical protein